MSTATAIKQSPAGTEFKTVTLELVPAIADDLKYFAGWEENGLKKIMKLRTGLIFWLYSNVKLEVESTPYIITESTSTDDLKEWLDAGMIYIAKNPFND